MSEWVFFVVIFGGDGWMNLTSHGHGTREFCEKERAAYIQQHHPDIVTECKINQVAIEKPKPKTFYDPSLPHMSY